MTDPVTVLLSALLSLAFCFAVLAWYLWRNKERILFRINFTENKRQKKTNSFLAALVSQPDNSRVWGTDHSHWDGNVNFTITRARGASFTIIKCSEGTVPTRYYHENTVAARNAGLVVGGYHWLHRNSNVSCAAQAKVAWDRIKGYPNQLPLMVDFEWTRYNGIAANPSYTDLELFVDEFIKLSGRKPCMYSAPGYLSPLGPIPRRLRDKLAYIVIASYYVDTPSYPDWLFHQFTDLGDADSLAPSDTGKKETDLIYFNGTLSALYRLAGLSTPIPPPQPEPEEPTMTLYGTVIQGTQALPLNIRNGPGTSYDDIGNLYVGDKVEASDNLGGWWKLTKITRAAGGSILATQSLGYAFANSGLYIRTDAPPVTPPAPVPAGTVVVSLAQTIRATINGVNYIARADISNLEMTRE
jgi:lysozyme